MGLFSVTIQITRFPWTCMITLPIEIELQAAVIFQITTGLTLAISYIITRTLNSLTYIRYAVLLDTAAVSI